MEPEYLTEGLLWYPDCRICPENFEALVTVAARRARDKKGFIPAACHVHPDNLDKIKAEKVEVLNMGAIPIVASAKVLRGHLYLIREDNRK